MVGLVIVFFMLVVGPTLRSAQMDMLSQRREIYNEVTNMLDRVLDTGNITNAEIQDFYLGVSSRGVPVDIKIERYIKVINPDGTGGTYYVYSYSDDITTWNKGDVCKLTVKQIATTNMERLAYNFSSMFTPPINVEFAGRVRN